MGATTSRTEPSLFPNVEAHAKTIAKNIMNPKSTKQAPGVEHAMYQEVGRNNFATIMPDNLPMPAFCSTLCCHWCGFPCNMLCPCFCAFALCWPGNPMMCGYCCGKPEGKGLATFLNATREQNMIAEKEDIMSRESQALEKKWNVLKSSIYERNEQMPISPIAVLPCTL
jgi:hypothetical protein